MFSGNNCKIVCNLNFRLSNLQKNNERYQIDYLNKISNCIIFTEKEGIKKSDYINNAISFYEKNRNSSTKQDKVNELDILLPPLHKLFDLINNVKHDYAEELLRLERNKKITLDKLTEIVLSIIILHIQFMKTETVKKTIDLIDEKTMIYSKRDTMNHVAIDKLKGVFFDRLKKIKEEQDLEEQKKRSIEKKKKIKEQWEKENPNYEYGLSYGLEKKDWVSKEEVRIMEEKEKDTK